MATPAQIAEVLRVANKALALPAAGVHAGGGRHVVLQPTWDGLGEVPPGWTATAGEAVDLGAGNIELTLGAREIALLNLAASRARCTPAELATLDARLGRGASAGQSALTAETVKT